ncbi:hypothetical protein [Saccharothrix australiensis]|uniref:hypothetical protein n=1 Tax=Saccharothrix australiensis TaxID=2072 RepID=UPI0011C40083|nr:hypothetical protein [Saccharothrix australiensis]
MDTHRKDDPDRELERADEAASFRAPGPGTVLAIAAARPQPGRSQAAARPWPAVAHRRPRRRLSSRQNIESVPLARHLLGDPPPDDGSLRSYRAR